MSQREYKVSDAFVDSLFSTLYSAYLEREKLIEIDASIYQDNSNERIKDVIDKRLVLLQKDIELMLSILDTHKYDENIEYIKDNLRRKTDHLIEIKNEVNGKGLI